MNRLEHLLWVVAEECNEVGQRASKMARFGVYNTQEGHDKNNMERFLQEYADLLASVEMVSEELGYNISTADIIKAVAEKRAKVEKFLKYSEECGTLNTKDKQ